MEPGNNFCVLPYIHMAIESNGDIKPCCMGQSLGVNIANMTIHEAFNDPVRQKFIDSFDRNEKHPACKTCWNDTLSKFNMRVKFSTNSHVIKFTEAIMNGDKPKRELKWLEVKPGNRCNLKCRICGVHNSSQWTKDAYDLNQHIRKNDKGFKLTAFKESDEYKLTEQSKWIDNPRFWNDIQALDEIEYIHFMGGEPFMVPEHFQLLKKLLNGNVDISKIQILYNTNGTIFPTDKQIDLLQKFANVKIQLSIDDIGKRFEYQRKLADWEQVKSNIIKFKKLDSNKFKIGIDPTVSILNIWNLDEIVNGFAELGFILVSSDEHFVTGGKHDCRILPEAVKRIITKKFETFDNLWIKQAITFMNQKPIGDTNIKDFMDATEYLDILRNESFANLSPEYYNLIAQNIEI